MKQLLSLFLISSFLFSCNDNAETTASTTDTATVNPATDWKFGVALWTFHDVNFPDALARVDSAGLTYIEPNTFHATGPDLNDTVISRLSPAGLQQVKAMIAQKGLKVESIYIAGDTSLASWIHQFEIARELGVKFVTSEPPLSMWDHIDSLAGAYGMKVAIHEHWKGVSRYWHPDSVLAAIQGHPNFAACADLGHWPKSGIEPLEAVKKLSGHIIGIHLKDIAAFNDPKLKDVVAGTGVVKFPEIFRELKNQGFTGHIYIERDSVEPGGNVQTVLQTVKYYNDEIGKLK